MQPISTRLQPRRTWVRRVGGFVIATIAAPRRRIRFSRKAVLRTAIPLALLVVCAVAGIYIRNSMTAASQAAASAGWQTETAQSGTIDASISATGSVEPQAQAELRFAVNGTVTEILVKPGDLVAAGQPLARVGSADLQLSLEQAQASLKQAQADRDGLLAGATEQEIVAAKARVAQAQAQYQQAAGSVTNADIAAARARLDAAKARLAAIQSGSTDTRDAEQALQQAQTQLQSQRDQLSANKTNSQLQMEQRVNDLTRAQAEYATAKQNWQYVQETGKDPSAALDPTTGKKVHVKLDDKQRQQYYNAFVQAESAMHNAETAITQAQVAYDTARQAEVTGVQAAEQDVASAQAKIDGLRAGGGRQQLSSAQADVASAQAELNKLTGANRSGSLESAQAGVTIAQQDLEKLTSDPSVSALARAEAAVAGAEVAVKQAQRQLDQATLQAPFAATVAQVNLRVGESSSGGSISTSSEGTSSAGIVVADLSSFHVDVPVDELDVAQIKAGQTARVALDALADAELTGKVVNVEPLATQNDRGTNTYKVTIELDPTEVTLRSGMTATAQIVTQSKPNAVLVPRRAVLLENGQSYVLIPKDGPPDTAAGRPASDRREVTLGLSNAEFVEITSGLQPGDKVLVQDVVQTFNPVGNGG
jgi:HlyD family secretion protein